MRMACETGGTSTDLVCENDERIQCYVSLERAREVYGVVVAPDGRIDPDATALRRARLAGRGPGDGETSDG